MERHWRWLARLTPLALGLLLAVLLEQFVEPMRYIYLRAELSALAWVSGALLSAILLIALFAGERLKEREDALREEIEKEAAEERRRFLRRLDHELKNPLTAVRAALVNLRDASSGTTEQSDALASIENQVLRISRLVADLRKLAELETRALDCVSVDMTSLLEEAVTVVKDRPGPGERRVTLSVPRAPWPLPHVAGDWDLLFLAVYNLLDNALKFTREEDTVEVRAFEDGANVVIEVADTGPGIPEEDRAHIWEELYRGKGARGIAGSGLGLPLVRAIVERHGGRVTLRSRQGQGTVFIMRLPVGDVTSR